MSRTERNVLLAFAALIAAVGVATLFRHPEPEPRVKPPHIKEAGFQLMLHETVMTEGKAFLFSAATV